MMMIMMIRSEVFVIFFPVTKVFHNIMLQHAMLEVYAAMTDQVGRILSG